ncbi:maleylpyruvate isomerase N-terminal domain-containing protein [Nonomuraea antimicrobica]
MTTYVPHRNRRAYEQAPTRLSPPLRTEHDRLSGLAPTFSEDDLARPSGAAEWDISQVLSHLGSGTEIRRATPRPPWAKDRSPSATTWRPSGRPGTA